MLVTDILYSLGQRRRLEGVSGRLRLCRMLMGLLGHLYVAGHLSALGSTLAAGFGAGLAVCVLVLCTLFGAGFADMGAKRANLFRVDAAACHEACGEMADGCAVDVVADAVRHHGRVFFGEAGGRAVIASVGAGIAGSDTGLVLFV